MKTPILSTSLMSPSNTQTNYFPISGGVQSWQNNVNNKNNIFTTSGTLGNLMVSLNTAPSAARSWTFTLMKNGEATGVSCVISGTDTFGISEESVSVSPGDYFCLRSVPSSTPLSSNLIRISLLFTGSSPGESVISGITSVRNNATHFVPLSTTFTGLVGVTSELTQSQIMPCNGTFKNLYVRMNNSPGTAPDAYRFTLMVGDEMDNLSATDLSCEIVDPDTMANDVSHSVNVSAKQYVCLRIEPLNSPSANNISTFFGFTFVPEIDGEAPLLGSFKGGVNPSGSNQYTQMLFGSLSYQSFNQEVLQETTIKKARLAFSAPQPAVSPYSFFLSKNETDEDLSIVINQGESYGEDLIHEVSFEAGDLGGFRTDYLNVTPMEVVKYSCVSFIEPPPPTSNFFLMF